MSDPAPDDAPPAEAGAEPRPPRRRLALAAVLLCITLPGALALVEGATFYVNNRGDGFITVDGRTRGYALHLPRNRDPSRPVPLVVSLHAGGLWGAAQREISRWNEVADREGFIVAYPSGAGHASPRRWYAGPGDIEFITRLIDTLVARHNADPDRVYVNGMSNGGGMTFALSCAIPDRIAAVGIVAGALSTVSRASEWENCAGVAPMPVVFFHGTADPVAPYDGGRSWVSPRPFSSIPAWVDRWAERNGCAAAPHDSALAADVTRLSYAGCARGADVVFYTLHGDGHVWPGGGAVPAWLAGTDSRSLDATEVMWNFFRERRSPAVESATIRSGRRGGR